MKLRRYVLGLFTMVACSGDSESDSGEGSQEGASADSGSADGNADASSSSAGSSNDGSSADESGSSDGSSSDGGSAESGPPELDCEDPEPILQPGTDLPTGFERCSDGFVHRVEAVTCAQPTPADTCVEADEFSDCETAADCTERPYGACDSEPKWLGGGCGCIYGCESDADCGTGEICSCDGLAGPRCIAAGCVTDADCDGLCGWSPIGGGCGASGYQLACLDDGAECRTSCPEEEGCYGNLGEPRCEIIEGEWTCNIDSLCEDCG